MINDVIVILPNSNDKIFIMKFLTAASLDTSKSQKHKSQKFSGKITKIEIWNYAVKYFLA